MKTFFRNKKILVTGGCGSIGSEIVRQLLNSKPRFIRVLDNNESGLFDLYNSMENDNRLRILLGDIRDKERMVTAMENIDIVFHAAAYKHVHHCEYSPFEAVKTNVLGTQNVVDAALKNSVSKLIFISTDKAVNPIGTMGASKLLAEKLVTAANYYRGAKRTVFSSVRFGNVAGSRGSVIPFFKEQITNGKCVTITHPEMTRFVMSIPEAVTLVLKAAEMAVGGETFVLKMPALKIKDLAEVLIEKLSPDKKIGIKTIGTRPGEKFSEQLMSSYEMESALETDDLFIILPQTKVPRYIYSPFKYKGAKPLDKSNSIDSSHGKLLAKEEIRDLLKKMNLL
jgi:FlaA1/EpsC-like NDP-sugar epimerase